MVVSLWSQFAASNSRFSIQQNECNFLHDLVAVNDSMEN